MPKLLIATHNAGKIRDFKAILVPLGYEVVSGSDLGLPEPDESEVTFVGNARIKAYAAAKATGIEAISDDSGIEIAILGGAPGVLTADWSFDGNGGRDTGLALQRMQREISSAGGVMPQLARICCALVMARPDGTDDIFVANISGHIVWPPRGDHGFGFDPVFVPDGETRTLAEMTPDVKSRFSHRGQATRMLLDHLALRDTVMTPQLQP